MVSDMPLVSGLALSGNLHIPRHIFSSVSIIMYLVGSCVLSLGIGMMSSKFSFTSLDSTFTQVFSIRDGLRFGEREVFASDLPTFLWPVGVFELDDTYKGFLRSNLLVTVSFLKFVYSFTTLTFIGIQTRLYIPKCCKRI